MPLAASDFEDLVSSMGLAGTAASNLDDIMSRLAASTLAAEAAAKAEAAAARVAAGTGVSVAEVKKALAAANAEAAASAKAAAAEQAAAAKEIAAAEREAAKERAAAARAAAAEQAAAAREAAREEKAAAREAAAIQREADREARSQAAAQAAERAAKSDAHKKAAQEAAAARAEAQKTAAAEAAASRAAKQQAIDTFAHAAATQGLTAAMGPYGQAVDIVIQRVTLLASVMKDAAAMAIRLTQEDDALRSSLGALAGGGDEAGQAIMDLIDGLGDLPFAAGPLEGWAKSLLSAGVQGERLETGLRAIAAATAIMGAGGTAAAEGLIKRFHMMAEAGQKVTLDRRIMGQLAQAGVTVADLAKQLGVPAEKLAGMALDADKLGVAMQNALITKGVGPLQRMGQTFESMRSKIVDAFEDAFANLGDLVRPFMAEAQSLASEFFKGSVASTTFGGAVKAILTPAFEIGTKAVRAMHIALLMAEIGYLKAVIAMRPVSEFLERIATRAQWLEAIMYVLGGAAIALTIAFAALAVVVFLVALPFIVAAAAVILLVIGLVKLAGVIDGAMSNLDNIGNKVSETGEGIVTSVMAMVSGAASALFNFPLAAAEAGVNFVTGLIQAITSGQGPVADAVRQLARGAISAITGAFQTRSPSRVTAKIGGYFTEGLAGGIDDGAGDVEAAAGGAGDAAVGGLKSGMRKGSGGGGGGGRGGGKGKIAETIQFIYQGPADQFDDFAERAEKWLEQMAGEGPDPEPAS